MKIALLGYGNMGREIESLVNEEKNIRLFQLALVAAVALVRKLMKKEF